MMGAADTLAGPTPPAAARQRRVGLTLAALIVSAWTIVHVLGVFLLPATMIGPVLAVAVIAAQVWLSVGLFIVAHDCMHGTLAPGWPRANEAIGAACAALYCGFPYRALRRAHFAHHAAPGTEDDPDFHAPAPRALFAWYWAFMRAYFGWANVVFVAGVLGLEIGLLGADIWRVVLLWAVPAILSSFQLFFFGTWLPHRVADAPFADRHRARTVDLAWLPSLLTCFHFGYHHEHHIHPGVPWWALPGARRAALGRSR